MGGVRGGGRRGGGGGWWGGRSDGGAGGPGGGRCRRTFTPALVMVERRCRYGRDVRRCAIDLWQHGGSSARRTAEWVRSLVGQQERWRIWRPWAASTAAEPCRLQASTVHRWLDD